MKASQDAGPRLLPVLFLLAVAACQLEDGADSAAGVENPKEGRTMPEHTHHAIDYIELSVTDMAESQSFYGAAFGWAFNDYGPEYAGIRRRAGDPTAEVGGLRLSTEVVTGGPLIILYSDDLGASLAAVREAGGEIVREPFGFPGGRRFHFLDPSGNELAIWTPAEE